METTITLTLVVKGNSIMAQQEFHERFWLDINAWYADTRRAAQPGALLSWHVDAHESQSIERAPV